MRLRELIQSTPSSLIENKQLGRAFNHLEDLVFFYGSQGTLEALQHLKDFATEPGAKSIRMKWDGNPQIYWGREQKNGPLILAGHNGWARGANYSNPSDIEHFIAAQSGNPKTPEEKTEREQFAKQFANLHPLLDAATPKDFVGFVYGDALFLQRPELDSTGVYNFCPNPRTQTCYHVKANSKLGNRISNANIMIVGHAYFPKFGMPDSAQEPLDDFSAFNNTTNLIVQEPIYNSSSLSINTDRVSKTETYLRQHATQIDKFLDSVQGLSDLKDIIYKFVNQTAKAKQLDSISTDMFFNWLLTSKVSVPKQEKILNLSKQYNPALDAIFSLVKQIQEIKDEVINQIEAGHSADVWDSHGEGRVRYSGPEKKFGNIKLVPRKRWTPA